MPRTRAIALTGMPRPRQSSTSCSRRVSWGTDGCDGPAGARPVLPAKVDGATSIWPAVTRVSTSIISESDPPLGMKAEAPACAARTTHSGSLCAVTTATTVRGATSRIRRVAANPSCRGISMSITTMSGCSSSAMLTAWVAECAVPRVRMPADSSAPARSSAKVRWSSTTRTLAWVTAVGRWSWANDKTASPVGQRSAPDHTSWRGPAHGTARGRLLERANPPIRTKVLDHLRVRRASRNGTRGNRLRSVSGSAQLGRGPRDRPAPGRSAGGNRADMAQQIVGIVLLEQVARHPQLPRLLERVDREGAGEHHDPAAGVHGAQGARGLEPGDARHGQVEDDDVRMGAHGRRHHLVAVGADGDDGHVLARGQQLDERVANVGVVVRDQYLDHAHLPGRQVPTGGADPRSGRRRTAVSSDRITPA